MSFKDIILIELKKIKRSKLLILILVPPLLVVLSGITNISQYFSSESKEVWSAMFVQSALLFGYYLLPLTMLIVCTVLNGIEQKNNGLNKMFSLPIAKRKIALAKFIVIIIFILIEILTFFVIFSIAGLWITSSYNLNEPIPYIYIYIYLSGV